MAEDLEFEFKREIARIREEDIHLRWGEWFTECMNLLKITSQPSTCYSYEKTCLKWINPHWNGRELRAITNMDVHELLYVNMVDENVTMHTRKYVLKIAKRIFQMAMDNGNLNRNPCQGMMVKVPENVMKVLSNSEVEILLREAKAINHRFYPVWILALFSGARSGELISLKWSDIDFESKTIRIARSWNKKNGFKSTKSQKTRIVPIGQELLGFLKELKIERGQEEFVLPRLSEWERGDAATY